MTRNGVSCSKQLLRWLANHQEVCAPCALVLHRANTKPLKTVSSNEWIEPTGMKTGIIIYNSITKQKNELILPRGNHLSW